EGEPVVRDVRWHPGRHAGRPLVPEQTRSPGGSGLAEDGLLRGRLRVISYRVVLDVPSRLGLFVSRLLGERRRQIGTRSGTGALSCRRQAKFARAWLRDRPGCGLGCVKNIGVQISVAAWPCSAVFSCPLSGDGS